MAGDQPHILVVDDDRRLRELLKKYLCDSGYRVTTAADAADARARLASLAFDVIVLDVMMPGESGLDLTRSLRRASSVPILLLTAMGEPADRIRGFETGADDYLPKPFEPRELLLRIQSILRRIPPRPEGPAEVRLGEYCFDLAREQLHCGADPVHLTSAEASLLKALARNAGTAVSREELSRQCRTGANVRTIDVQVTRLRRKIEPDPKLPRYLQTVRGRGYVLRPD
jgi:two-component system phosphate regulon response regulator OmpR